MTPQGTPQRLTMMLRCFLYFLDVTGHRLWVLWFCIRFAAVITWRGLIHDLSKYRSDEFMPMASTFYKFKKAKYGSKEYTECVEQIRPAVDRHYSRNSHHTAYHKRGVNDMNLYDLVEMYCDWNAACKRNPDGSVQQSIRMNQNKYSLTNQLTDILKNTAKD